MARRSREVVHPTALALIPRHRPKLVEWCELAEGRRRLILPHLENMKLSRLGDLKCLRTPGSKKLSMLHEAEAETGKPWDMEGIFTALARKKLHVAGQTESVYIWGLDSTGRWMVLTVEVETPAKDFVVDPSMAEIIVDYRLETGMNVLDISDATGVTPRQMCNRLGAAIHEHADRLQRLADKAEATHAAIRQEDAILRMRGCNTANP